MALVYNKQLEEGFKYIIESDRGEKKPFSVTIQPINSVKLMGLEDGLLKRDQANNLSISTGSYNVSLCKSAISAWENMEDNEGKALKIQTNPQGFISEESLSYIPTAIITEIAGVISSTSQDPANIQIFTEDN